MKPETKHILETCSSEPEATADRGLNHESTTEASGDIIHRLANKWGTADCKQPSEDYKQSHRPQERDLRRCGVRANYAGCTFDTFNDRGSLIDTLINIGNKSVVLQGGTGCGKTHLAVAVMAASELKENEMLFVKASWLLCLFRETNRDNSQERATDLLRKYSTIPLLILDDLGVGKGTDYVSEMISELIDWRDADGKQTIITTNLKTMQDIEDKYDARTASRLSAWECILIDKEDYRKRSNSADKNIVEFKAKEGEDKASAKNKRTFVKL